MKNNISRERLNKIYFNVFASAPEYLSSSFVYSLTFINGKSSAIDLAPLLKDMPNIQSAVLRIIHNFFMIELYAQRVIDGFSVLFLEELENYKLNPNKIYYIELEVTPNGLSITKKKGFGLIPDIKGIYVGLSEFQHAIFAALRTYESQLQSQGDKYTAQTIHGLSDYLMSSAFHINSIDEGIFNYIEKNLELFSDFDSQK